MAFEIKEYEGFKPQTKKLENKKPETKNAPKKVDKKK
jgi:hypothetical protein